MPEHFKLAGQRAEIEKLLGDQQRGLTVAHVILDEDRIIGRVTLSNIVRGPFQSCNLGYWIGRAENGRGHATRAVADLTVLAFSELDLHRIEAGTLSHNIASQRVLERNAFERFGLARRYLRIAWHWQDHYPLPKDRAGRLGGPGPPAASGGDWSYASASLLSASPNGLPSESRQIAHLEPGWMTLPPSSVTRSSAAFISSTAKYGRETVSPGPRPRSCTPIWGPGTWVCQPLPSSSVRPARATPSRLDQKRRARSGSSAGNSISDGRTSIPAVDDT